MQKDIEDIVADQDFIIGAADIPRDQILDWVNKICVKFKIPYICGGIDSMWAAYYSIIPGISGCMECWKSSASSYSPLFREMLGEEYFSAAVSPNVAIMPMISMVSGLISNEFLKIATGIAEPKSLGKLSVFDFKTAEIIVKETWQKELECPICKNI